MLSAARGEDSTGGPTAAAAAAAAAAEEAAAARGEETPTPTSIIGSGDGIYDGAYRPVGAAVRARVLWPMGAGEKKASRSASTEDRTTGEVELV